MVNWKLHQGDCIKTMEQMIKDGVKVHSVVTDAPYHLTSIVKRFGKKGSAPTVDEGVFRRSSTGFMGKEWDGGDIAFNKETWKLCHELLLPGGHLLAFAATKNYHKMATAIECANLEIRDMIGWIYLTGFPKSHVVGDGIRTALKPALEPICVARKPIDTKTIASNVITHGTGGLNIEACRVGTKFPSNIIYDGSDEIFIQFSDNATNFFYAAKPNKLETGDSKHPTKKPLELMKYLVRLVTPKGGTVLDPFSGTGTTLEAAYLEGMNSIGIEKDEEYAKDILKRMSKYERKLF